MTTLVLAHQGGWDELLMVLVPIAIFADSIGWNVVFPKALFHHTALFCEPNSHIVPCDMIIVRT